MVTNVPILKFCTNVTPVIHVHMCICTPMQPPLTSFQHSIGSRVTFSSFLLYSSSPSYQAYVESKTKFKAQDLIRIQSESINSYHSLPGFNYWVLPKFVILIILHSYIYKKWFFFNGCIVSYRNKANLNLKINI